MLRMFLASQKLPNWRRKSEFSQPVVREPVIAVADRKEPTLPLDHNRIEGKVLYEDHNTSCHLRLIQSYLGNNWRELQKMCVYLETEKELQEVSAFEQWQVGPGFILSDNNSTNSLIATTVSVRDEYRPWTDEVIIYFLKSRETKRLSSGQLLSVSPDHSTVMFQEVDRDGFYCLFTWNINVGRSKPILSMSEADPGSGPGWVCRWSQGSTAIEISGSCGGFYKNGRKKYTELNLIYVVKDDQMYSLK
jgi:hypothetical protein